MGIADAERCGRWYWGSVVGRGPSCPTCTQPLPAVVRPGPNSPKPGPAPARPAPQKLKIHLVHLGYLIVWYAFRVNEMNCAGVRRVDGSDVGQAPGGVGLGEAVLGLKLFEGDAVAVIFRDCSGHIFCVLLKF